MNVRRFAAALAGSCACLAAPAYAQTGRGFTISEPPPLVREQAPASGADFRPTNHAAWERAPSGLVQSWELDGPIQLGLGRFRVSDNARPRSHMERERHPARMEQETRAIAGAGLSIRF